MLLEVGYEPQPHLPHHGAMGFAVRNLGDGFYSRLGWFESARGSKCKDGFISADEAAALWKRHRDIFEQAEQETVIIV